MSLEINAEIRIKMTNVRKNNKIQCCCSIIEKRKIFLSLNKKKGLCYDCLSGNQVKTEESHKGRRAMSFSKRVSFRSEMKKARRRTTERHMDEHKREIT